MSYPLKDLVSIRYTRKPKFITSDRNGEYQSVCYSQKVPRAHLLKEQIVKLATKYGFDVAFTGTYFENSAQLHRLWIIFLIVALLLYFILVLQYESMVLPLLVMSTIFTPWLLEWIISTFPLSTL